MAKTYNIFISHSWKNDKRYNDLVGLLNNKGYFFYKDYSIDQSSAIQGNNEKVWKEIYSSIKMSSGLLVIAGVHITNSDSCIQEMKYAKEIGKPIIGIYQYGDKKASSAVLDLATTMVNWNTESIVEAIRDYF